METVFPSPDSTSASAGRFWQRLELDRAVFYALLLRAWQLVGGAITVALMTVFFTEEAQGFYYTFASLVALQTFFELGFNIAVVNVCSHEWSRLGLDASMRITGEAGSLSRLISLGRLLGLWYAAASLLFVLLVGVGGALFLGLRPGASIRWLEPWAALAVLSGLLLWTLPFNAVLEGCNQVTTVSLFRLIQAVVANLAVWTVMVWGGGLWAAVAATAARWLCDVYLLGVHYRRFFAAFLRVPLGPTMSWRTEVWPLQWRLAVQGVFSYFSFFLLTPVMFHYQGPVVAGQMGMTWTVLTAFQAASLAWVQTRVPRFGMLISQGQFRDLDRLFFRVAAVSFCAMAAACVAFAILLIGLGTSWPWIAERFLPLGCTTILCLATLAHVVAQIQVFYVRAHKREPFAVIGVVDSIAVGLGVWYFGSHFGPLGAAVSLFVVRALVTVPVHTYIWMFCRREWH